MQSIHITVTGKPVAKGRGQSRVINGKPVVHTPTRTRRWEQDARDQARLQMGDTPPLTGPLSLALTVYLAVPVSWSKWKQAAALDNCIVPTGKPDLDNYVKAAKDACNGVVWMDDSQIVLLTAHKSYTLRPRVELTATPLDRAAAQITRRDQLTVEI